MMMSAIESMSPFNARRTAVAPKVRAYSAAVVAKLRAVAPYALLELILPGGGRFCCGFIGDRERSRSSRVRRFFLFYSEALMPQFATSKSAGATGRRQGAGGNASPGVG
jgi:hypothetical protein